MTWRNSTNAQIRALDPGMCHHVTAKLNIILLNDIMDLNLLSLGVIKIY